MRFRDLDNVEVLLEIREIWHELATRKQVWLNTPIEKRGQYF